MSLPLSRNTTYTAASPIKSNDLNDIQDCIISTKRQPTWRNFFPMFSYVLNITHNSLGYAVATGNGFGFMQLPFDTGDRILACRVSAYSDGAADSQFAVNTTAKDMVTVFSLGSTNDLNRAAAWGDVTIGGPFVPTILTSTVGLTFLWTPNAANARCGMISIQWDRP